MKWSYIPYGSQGQQSRKTYCYQRNDQKIWKINEQGKREIPFCLAIRLAQMYNVSLDYIAGLSREPSPLHCNNIYTKK